MHGLLWDAHKHHERTARRELRFPPILARLELAGRFSGGRAFGMRRRLLHRLHGGEQGDAESEHFQEFHKMIRDGAVIRAESPGSSIRLSSYPGGLLTQIFLNLTE